MQYIVDIGSLNFRIRVRTNSDNIISLLRAGNQRAIPNYQFMGLALSDKPLDEINWIINIRETEEEEEKFGIDYKNHTVIINAPPNKILDKDIELILLKIFAELYAQENIWCSYGIGMVSNSQDGIFLIGELGSGKTIASLLLLLDGYRFLGNDRVLLKQTKQGIKMLSGSRPIRLRLSTADKYFPYLMPSSSAPSCGWGAFTSFDPIDLGIEPAPPTAIEYIFGLKISPVTDDDGTCCLFNELYGEFAGTRIYHSLSYFFQDFNLVNLGLKKIYPSSDTLEKANQRLDIAYQLLQKPAFEIHGNLIWVVDKIKSIVGKSIT